MPKTNYISVNGAAILKDIGKGGERYGAELGRRHDIEQNTIYMMLRRFEARGLVKGRWAPGRNGAPTRKYYKLTAEGRGVVRPGP